MIFKLLYLKFEYSKTKKQKKINEPLNKQDQFFKQSNIHLESEILNGYFNGNRKAFIFDNAIY